MIIKCGACGGEINVDVDQHSGQQLACPHCDKPFFFSAPQIPPPPPLPLPDSTDSAPDSYKAPDGVAVDAYGYPIHPVREPATTPFVLWIIAALILVMPVGILGPSFALHCPLIATVLICSGLIIRAIEKNR